MRGIGAAFELLASAFGWIFRESFMRHGQKIGTALACLVLAAGAAAAAEPGQNHEGGQNHEPVAHAAARGEAHPGPSG